MKPTIDYLRECFDCDFETGILTWRVRPREHFATDRGWKIFDTLYAGDVVGSVTTKGYLATKIVGRSYQNHRIVFALYHGHWPVNQIDHIDRNPANNAITNLRDVLNRENCHNKKNNNVVVGVSIHRARRKYQVQIQVTGHAYGLGQYTNHDDAAKVSNYAQSLIHDIEAFKIFKSLSTKQKLERLFTL